MGCCYSSDTVPSNQNPDTKLLIPHLHPEDRSIHSDDWGVAAHECTSADDHALLTAIVDKTAKRIIDVSAVNSPGMQHHEYMDRVRQYSTKLLILSKRFTWKRPAPLPSLTSQPHQTLAANFVPYSDLQQVSRVAAYAFSAILQIRVDAKEDLVVHLASL